MSEVRLCEKADGNGMRQCVTVDEFAILEAGYVRADENARLRRNLWEQRSYAYRVVVGAFAVGFVVGFVVACAV